MQIEIPDTVIDALRESLTPILDRLIEERVEQRRPLLLSVTQVAEELNCSRASVFGLIHGGHLEAIRTGRSYRVATANLHEYVEELTKPSYDRAVVSTRTRPQLTARPARRTDRVERRQAHTATVLPATRPPRSPRPKKESGMFKKEIADGRCTVAEFAERWWGMESAIALLDRSGVVQTDGPIGPPTFRYGDLIEWMESHGSEFEQWLEEFDPTVRRRSSQPDP
jgi:excisionase family DNA binding protein